MAGHLSKVMRVHYPIVEDSIESIKRSGMDNPHSIQEIIGGWQLKLEDIAVGTEEHLVPFTAFSHTPFLWH